MKTSEFVSPGTAVERVLNRRLDAGWLKNVPVAAADNVRSTWAGRAAFGGVSPAQWQADKRRLQTALAGKLVDVFLGSLAVGGAIGMARGGKKMLNTKRDLDAIESTRNEHGEATVVPLMTAKNSEGGLGAWLGDLAGKYVTLPARTLKDVLVGISVNDALTATPYSVGIAGLPKGSFLPLALALGAGGVELGNRAATRFTNEQREKMLAERKAKLHAQFDRLLAAPLPAQKEAEVDACSAYVDALADGYAAYTAKAAMTKDEGEAAVLGLLYTAGILSAIGGYHAGYTLRSRRDVGAIEQAAMRQQVEEQRTKTPVTLRMSTRQPSPTGALTRVSAYAAHPVSFPATTKDADLGEWWGGVKQKAREETVNWTADALGVSKDFANGLMFDKDYRKNLTDGAHTMQQVGKFVNGIKGFGHAAWGSIKPYIGQVGARLGGGQVGTKLENTWTRLFGNTAQVPGAR